LESHAEHVYRPGTNTNISAFHERYKQERKQLGEGRAGHEEGHLVRLARRARAGLVAARIGNVPGASTVLRGGIVAYANDVKSALIGVPSELIEEHGAVSAEVAISLATQIRVVLGSDVGIGVTGIAGPGGGSASKPTGLVHVAVVGPHGLEQRLERRFPGDRDAVRSNSATAALHHVRLLLADAALS
jgi:nicotinamide-nucleotide amidase